MPPGRRFGKYLLHEKLAVGGMGELYLATPAGAAKGTPPSVLKILLPEYSADADFVSMFHDEARIGMQLTHPNIVSVQDLGRVSDTPYIVLEYVHGENVKNLLRQVMEGGEKFPPELAVRIMIEALYGLDHAHNAKDARGKPLNLVHRDLSPDNIMVSFEGDVKVLDFGIAKAEGRATQTQFGILKGKAQYMAPEQAVGGEVDARTDLYAIGLVLLEVITGERRFSSETDPVQQIRDARVWKPRAPSERDKSLPIELDAIILKALQAEPNRRWNSAEEFAIALTRLLRDGKLPRSSENLPRFMRRMFPGRAEPYLTEDPTAGETDEASVLQNTGEMRLADPAPPVVKARARAAAAPKSEVHDDFDPNDVTSEGEAIEDTTNGRMEATAASETVAGLDEGRTLIQPGRQIRPLEPEDRPTMPPARVMPPPPPPLPRTAPPPPAPQRIGAAAPLPEIPARGGRLRAAVEDPRANEQETDSDLLGDGTRVGEFGGGTRVASASGFAREAKTRDSGRRTRDAEMDAEFEPEPEPEPRRRGAPPPPPSRRADPSADERRAPARGGARTKRARPPIFLMFLLTFTLLLVGAAAGALVFKDQLPPALRARIVALTEKRRPGKPVSTPEATPTAVAEASPASSTAAVATDTPEEDATPHAVATSQKAVGGGMFPVESDSATPAPSSTPAHAATATATPTTKPVATLTPIPRATQAARATPRPTAVASAKDKAIVRIVSKPAGFEILVDGVGTGKKTPATVQVEPGMHTLSLKADGYRAWNFQEELKAGDTLQLPADLVPN